MPPSRIKYAVHPTRFKVEPEYKELKEEAEERDVPIGQIVREAVAKHQKNRRRKQRKQ